MRSALLLLFLLWAGIAVQAQVVLLGQISGVADEPLGLTYTSDLFGSETKVSVPVANGAFSTKMNLPSSGHITVSYKDKDRRFYLWQGASELHISFDADFLDGEVTLGGSAATVHSFIEVLQKEYAQKLHTDWLDGMTRSATNVDGMEMEVFRLRNDALKAMNDFNAATPLPKEFMDQFKNHLGYYYYLSLFRFSSSKSAGSSIPKATEVPKVLIEGLNWVRMGRASELESPYFRELLLEFVHYKALEQFDFMKFANLDAAVNGGWTVARDHLPADMQSYWLTATMLRHGDQIRPGLLKRMHGALSSLPNGSANLTVVSTRFASRLQMKDEVAAAPSVEAPKDDIVFTDENGKPFGLSSFKGKVVYLDIWASWCGPCRQQFPHAKTLKEQLSKKELKEIVFLYISIDNTDDAWKKAMEQLQIDGTHGFSPGGWGAPITTKFQVTSIPRYIIIDKKGNVADLNAPRPSDPTLLDVLRGLMAK